MAFDADLAARLRRWFSKKGVLAEEKRMMGGLCFMVDGKMCAGVESDRLMLRLDPAKYEEMLQQPGCSPMDFTGRPLRGYVWVCMDALATDAALGIWAQRALEFNPLAKASKQTAKKTQRKCR